MAGNYQEGLYYAPINVSQAGDNVLIGPDVALNCVPNLPAAFENSAEYYAIDFITLIPQANVTLQMKDGASDDLNIATSPQTNYGGPLGVVAGQPLTWENAIENEHGVITMSPNHSFVLNLSVPAQVSGFIRFRRMVTN